MRRARHEAVVVGEGELGDGSRFGSSSVVALPFSAMSSISSFISSISRLCAATISSQAPPVSSVDHREPQDAFPVSTGSRSLRHSG